MIDEIYNIYFQIQPIILLIMNFKKIVKRVQFKRFYNNYSKYIPNIEKLNEIPNNISNVLIKLDSLVLLHNKFNEREKKIDELKENIEKKINKIKVGIALIFWISIYSVLLSMGVNPFYSFIGILGLIWSFL